VWRWTVNIPVMAGVTARTVRSERLTTRVLFTGREDAAPVVFLHGNLSSATWWEETMLRLPAGYRGIAPDLRGFGDADPGAKIDARRGMGDLAADLVALLDTLGIERAHVVGNSLGGSILWRCLATIPGRLLSAALIAPGSPYGFGGTKDIEGAPCHADFAGSGGGLVNPELLRRMSAGDRSLESPFTLRAALRALVFKPPFVPAREEELLSAALATHLGEFDYPGDRAASANWPFVAPGVWGASNALSPKYALAPETIVAATPKVRVLWARGSHDAAVSNRAASDPGTLGEVGLIPGWPGREIYPAQPMVDQTRAVLDRYEKGGAAVREVVIPDTGHVPHLERPDAFDAVFHSHLAGAA
jgi:pimeloyl-ACP methyl ester carboxylesterase